MPDAPDKAESNVPPRPLDYRSPADEKRQLPRAVQALIGFALSAGTSAAVNFAIGFLAFSGGGDKLVSFVVTLMIVLVQLAVFVGIGREMRSRGRWPAFLPGALAGWGVATLVEGICFAGLTNSRF